MQKKQLLYAVEMECQNIWMTLHCRNIDRTKVTPITDGKDARSVIRDLKLAQARLSCTAVRQAALNGMDAWLKVGSDDYHLTAFHRALRALHETIGWFKDMCIDTIAIAPNFSDSDDAWDFHLIIKPLVHQIIDLSAALIKYLSCSDSSLLEKEAQRNGFHVSLVSSADYGQLLESGLMQKQEQHEEAEPFPKKVKGHVKE